jgi:hypothetical protein
MPNNNYKHPLSEGLQFRDLDGMMKPTIHVDEFSSKMGDDEDIIVLSFFVRDKGAAKDLVSWFEKGYDFVLDSDRSPGELKPNRYLVYLEIRRRSSAPQNVQTLLDDLSTLTEFEPSDWIVHYKDKKFAWNEDDFARAVPLNPDAYRASTDQGLNEWRSAAGLPEKSIYRVKRDLQELQAAAGLL